MSLRLYDAHNHFQDERFGGRQGELLTACANAGVACMVVNGSSEADWPQVLALARKFPLSQPSATLSPSDGQRDGVLGRTYRVPGYPFIPIVFIAFALTFLGFTVYNDFMTYREAVAAGQPALINSIFGVALVLIGTPIYFYYRRQRSP